MLGDLESAIGSSVSRRTVLVRVVVVDSTFVGASERPAFGTRVKHTVSYTAKVHRVTVCTGMTAKNFFITF